MAVDATLVFDGAVSLAGAVGRAEQLGCSVYSARYDGSDALVSVIIPDLDTQKAVALAILGQELRVLDPD